ncbi:helix-turn-helix domain-containing protein [Rhizobium sp. EC-SD404]|uniref:helix-turn-helix domain-containing protein n=1 Tax=Rhizobium sp. EC-SD404 TaxID=2038389 RepID=UPI001258EA59|nr:hypothetical protein RHIZ404_200282 [Rhizobium sp. EC-SD404]
MRPPVYKEEFKTKSFTPDTLAERWQCSPQHIRDLVKRGELPCFRVGRLIRITVETVLAYERGQPLVSPRPEKQRGYL